MISVIDNKEYVIKDDAPKPVVLGVPSYPVAIWRNSKGEQTKQLRYNVIDGLLYETGAVDVEHIPQVQPNPNKAKSNNGNVSTKEVKLARLKNKDK